MTEPHRTHRVQRFPSGDGARITPVTRIVWVAGGDLPPGRSTEAVLDLDTGNTVLLIHESLATDPGTRRTQMKQLRKEIHGLGGGKLAAFGVVTLDGLRRFGWRWLPVRVGSAVTEHLMPVAAAVGGGIALTHHAPPAACAVPSSQRCIAWHRHHPVHVQLVSGGNESWCRGAAVVAIQGYVLLDWRRH